MKLKEYKDYINILVKNFNDFLETRDLEKGEAIHGTATFFLKNDCPEELKEICKLIDKYFETYFVDKKSYQLDILEYKIRFVA